MRGMGRKEEPHLGDCALNDYIRGDLTDRRLVDSAVQDMNTVLHLAAYRNDADFVDVLLEPNVIGLHHVCDASLRADVNRLMLASTLQVVAGFGPDHEPIRPQDGARPTNHYALTKAWSELYGEMVARCHNLSIINARIGWLPRNPAYAQRLLQSEDGVNIYFSHRDAQRFFERCVESESPGPGESITIFAASRSLKRTRLSLESASNSIGYQPQDVWPNGMPFAVEGF